jgi:hypothetical protein
MSSELTQEYLDEDYVVEDDSDDEFVDENYVNQNIVKIPDWHMAILEERMARYANEDVTKWTTLEEFEKELLTEELDYKD